MIWNRLVSSKGSLVNFICMHFGMVFDGLKMTRHVGARFERRFDDLFDLRRGAMGVTDGGILGKEQVEVNPMEISQASMPQMVVLDAALLGLYF